MAIRDCAWITSDYPIVLSFENHCCKSQQYKMAKYIDEIFGEYLLKEPLPEHPVRKNLQHAVHHNVNAVCVFAARTWRASAAAQRAQEENPHQEQKDETGPGKGRDGTLSQGSTSFGQ